tara:strand:+ start:2202 stop:3059 length:858 start_codon:yes stop_codon:yes gene_type:complete
MFLDFKKLEKIALENAENYRNNFPSPYLIIDDFIDLYHANQIAKKFPGPEEIDWVIHGSGANADKEDFKGTKLQCSSEKEFPEIIQGIMHEFNSQKFLYFLKMLTGVDYIFGDPYYNGCGLHSTGRGGRLMIHADVNRYPYPEIADQYLNCIYYVSPNWEESWGGNLELWDKKCKSCIKSINPKFNRLVIFKTDRTVFHGHPYPINCPDNRRRNTLATYFYVPSNLYQSKSKQIQTVLWQRTNKLDRKFSLKFIKYLITSIFFDFTPPIISRKINKLKKNSKKRI